MATMLDQILKVVRGEASPPPVADLIGFSVREVEPGRIYPRDAKGQIAKYDDLPARFHANIDTADAPFDRKPGEKRPMTDSEIADIIAFLGTLDDGADGPAKN